MLLLSWGDSLKPLGEETTGRRIAAAEMERNTEMKKMIALLIVAFAMSANAGVPTGERGFLLGGTAQNAQDPENPANDVIKIDTTLPGSYGTVSRSLGVQIARLENMLEFKSYFQNRSCGGGSPRIQLAVDLNGDGVPEGNAFGYTAPPFAGCAPNRWQYDDVTDEQPRWDITQLVTAGFPSPGSICSNPVFSTNPLVCPLSTHSGYITWNAFKIVLTTLYPNHKVCKGALVDDSSWLPGAAGVAYYDIISIGRATWEDQEDSVGRGFARGCGQADEDDQDMQGDENHDRCVNSDDSNWQARHHDD